MQPVGAVRNYILKRRSIIESYSGEIFGIGVEVGNKRNWII